MKPLPRTLSLIDQEIEDLEDKVAQSRLKNRDRMERIRALKDQRRALNYPPEPDTDVIAFVKAFRGNPIRYRYVAMRDEQRKLWWATGPTGPNGVTWRALVDFIRRDNVLAAPMYSTMHVGSDRLVAHQDV